eukprot:10275718-Heterocapsa_arctica.AAC.1
MRTSKFRAIDVITPSLSWEPEEDNPTEITEARPLRQMVSDNDGGGSDVVGYEELLDAMTRSTSAAGSGHGMD